MADDVAQVPGAEQAQLSDADPYGDEPPRLAEALNQARTDVPPGTEWTTRGEARKTIPKDKPKGGKGGKAPAPEPPPPEPGDDAKVPAKNVIEEKAVYTADTVGSILKWVAGRIEGKDDPLDEAWAEQEGPAKRWHTTDDEEGWAKAVTNLFLGADYIGPASAYDFGSAGPYPAMNENWENYIFSRIERFPKRVPVEVKMETRIATVVDPQTKKQKNERKTVEVRYGAYNLASWKNPTAPTKIDEPAAENLDPAVSIGVACQHLTTYGALSRGVALADLEGVGFMASDGVAGFKIFKGEPEAGGAEEKSGASGEEAAAGEGEEKPAAVLAEAPKGKLWHTADSGVTTIEEAFAKAPDLGPGSVIVYDPDGGLKKVELKLSKYEMKYRLDRTLVEFFKSRKALGTNQFDMAKWGKERDQAPDYTEEINKEFERYKAQRARDEKDVQDIAEKQNNAAGAEKRRAMYEKAWRSMEDAIAAKQKANEDRSTTLQTITLNRQLDGSHINCILRVHPDKKRVQFLDTSSHNHIAVLAKTGSSILVQGMQGGIMDGNNFTTIPIPEGKTYIGFGVLPPPKDLPGQIPHLKKARPVGLARLVITERNTWLPKEKVLYASRLIRMYGNAETQNYTISRLLWSLRNTPGFTNVQPWWFVFAPRGLLARAMWAEGGREMTLPMFVEEFANRDDKAYWGFFDLDESAAEQTARHKEEKESGVKLRGDDLGKQLAKRGKMKFERHYIPLTVLTNDGGKIPAYAGKAVIQCRYKYVVGKAQLQTEGPDVPSAIKGVLRNLGWNEVYLHKSLEEKRAEIEGATPDVFKDPGSAPAAAPGKTAELEQGAEEEGAHDEEEASAYA